MDEVIVITNPEIVSKNKRLNWSKKMHSLIKAGHERQLSSLNMEHTEFYYVALSPSLYLLILTDPPTTQVPISLKLGIHVLS